jgi:hypothetical protein
MLYTSPMLHSVVDSDGAAILDVQDGTLIRLNSTGSYIWERLLQGEQPGQILLSLAAETSTDADLIRQDVDAFVEELLARHLLGAGGTV